MKTNEFRELSERLGLTAYGTGYCGVIDQWPLTLTNSSGLFLQVAATPGKDRYMAGQIRTELKSWGGKLKSWSGDRITISAPSARKMQGSTADYVRFVLRLLTRAGLRPSDTCPYCGQGGCDAAALTAKGYRPAHYSCLRAESGKAHTKARANQENGSYLLGIIGAVLGMILGTIPTLLTIIYAEREYAVLFALIPILAYYGYKLFGGRMDRTALAVSIVMAVVGVFLLYFECAAYMLVRNYGYALSDMKTIIPKLMRDPDVWKEAVTGSLTEFLFAALGVFIAWGSISRTAAGAAASADAVLRLARPYGSRASSDTTDPTDMWE